MRLTHFITEWAISDTNEPWFTNARIYDLLEGDGDRFGVNRTSESNPGNGLEMLIKTGQEMVLREKVNSIYKDHFQYIMFACEKHLIPTPKDFMENTI